MNELVSSLGYKYTYERISWVAGNELAISIRGRPNDWNYYFLWIYIGITK